ncbi:MAG: nucleoside-diphosphate sugar epimerase, partial [Planctomycetota bacterium]
HVSDVVVALSKLMRTPEARGQVVNIGSTEEVTIAQLAERVKQVLKSTSPIQFIPYDKAYVSGFEDMVRRVPCIEKAQRLIGYAPRHTLDDCIRDTAEAIRREL